MRCWGKRNRVSCDIGERENRRVPYNTGERKIRYWGKRNRVSCDIGKRETCRVSYDIGERETCDVGERETCRIAYDIGKRETCDVGKRETEFYAILGKGKHAMLGKGKPAAEMRSGSEEGSYSRLVDFCITHL